MNPQHNRHAMTARLNRKKTAVVCGSCGARIGAIVPTSCLQPSYSNFGANFPAVQFDAGWTFDPRANGWRFSNYARKRIAIGRSAKVRKYPISDGAIHGNSLMDPMLEPLPTPAECRDCRRINLLTKLALGVEYFTVIPAAPRDESRPLALG